MSICNLSCCDRCLCYHVSTSPARPLPWQPHYITQYTLSAASRISETMIALDLCQYHHRSLMIQLSTLKSENQFFFSI